MGQFLAFFVALIIAIAVGYPELLGNWIADVQVAYILAMLEAM